MCFQNRPLRSEALTAILACHRSPNDREITEALNIVEQEQLASAPWWQVRVCTCAFEDVCNCMHRESEGANGSPWACCLNTSSIATPKSIKTRLALVTASGVGHACTHVHALEHPRSIAIISKTTYLLLIRQMHRQIKLKQRGFCLRNLRK
jgi:hypothetical protein